MQTYRGMREHLDTILIHKGRKVHAVETNSTVADAVRLMVRARVGSVLVLENSVLKGIFTERDAMVRVLYTGADPSETLVSEVMTDEPVTVAPWTTVEEAMKIMTERRFRRLPVVLEGEVLGLISIGDLTKWVVRDNEQLERYITGTYPG